MECNVRTFEKANASGLIYFTCGKEAVCKLSFDGGSHYLCKEHYPEFVKIAVKSGKFFIENIEEEK